MLHNHLAASLPLHESADGRSRVDDAQSTSSELNALQGALRAMDEGNSSISSGPGFRFKQDDIIRMSPGIEDSIELKGDDFDIFFA